MRDNYIKINISVIVEIIYWYNYSKTSQSDHLCNRTTSIMCPLLQGPFCTISITMYIVYVTSITQPPPSFGQSLGSKVVWSSYTYFTVLTLSHYHFCYVQ